ncbi:uncharacterized protein LOC142557029 isoform X2 [Dermacentor variabilis]|uniref:uncharacterized protein LOC142557029 isoform X2 n=1 Tax=Dermacentor variabilis TaxID=34621 RepID=UPI003F5C93A2
MHCRKMILKLLGKGVKPSPSVVLAEWSPVGSKAASSQSSSDDSGDEGTGTSGAGQSELLTFLLCHEVFTALEFHLIQVLVPPVTLLERKGVKLDDLTFSLLRVH